MASSLPPGWRSITSTTTRPTTTRPVLTRAEHRQRHRKYDYDEVARLYDEVGLTQTQIAERLGTDQSRVSRMIAASRRASAKLDPNPYPNRKE